MYILNTFSFYIAVGAKIFIYSMFLSTILFHEDH